MNTQTDIKVLGSLLALHLEVNIWTARKKLSPEDFDGAKLPPDDLASLGSKRVCDPEDLNVGRLAAVVCDDPVAANYALNQYKETHR